MDEEELALDISQRWRVDRRHILGAYGDLAAKSARLVRPEEQPRCRPHECQHRSNRAEGSIAQELTAIRAHRETALVVTAKEGEKRRGDPAHDQTE
jgi:hypothetical protein